MVNLANSSHGPPQILEYRDYRRFISDCYYYRKSLRAGFSFRRFSQMVGVRSPNYLQLVMQGKRNLSESMGQRVAKTLGLAPREKRYFIALVNFESAKTDESRLQAQGEILCAVRDLISKEIPKAKIHVLTEWYHLLVRELVALPGFQPTGDWISSQLRGLISTQEAEHSLLWLKRSGFLSGKDGELVLTDPVVDTGNAFDELIGLKYHASTLQAWAKALPRTEKEFRELGVLNIPISTQKIPELKDRIRRFQDEIIGWLQNESEPDRVVQLGTYLIPTSK